MTIALRDILLLHPTDLKVTLGHPRSASLVDFDSLYAHLYGRRVHQGLVLACINKRLLDHSSKWLQFLR